MFQNFPPTQGMVVQLQFLQPAEFNFYHEMAVDAFVRHHLSLGEAYSHHFSLITPENGRLFYQTGDYYNFIVLATGNPELLAPCWRKLIRQLRALPESAPVRDAGVPLKDNIRLVSLLDYFDGIPVSNVNSLYCWQLGDAWQQAQSWQKKLALHQQSNHIDCTWQSSARLLRFDHKQYQGEKRFCRDVHHFSARLLFTRALDSIKNLLKNLDTPPALKEQIGVWQQVIEQNLDAFSIGKSDLFWVDTPYYNQNAEQQTLGGLSGFFRLHIKQGAAVEPLALLVLAQVLGIGQRRASGLGKLRVTLPTQAPWLANSLAEKGVGRAQSLLEAALQSDNINKAICLTEQKPGIDLLNEKTHAQIHSAIGQLRAGHYHPPHLQGFELEKKHGGHRLLAVSPLFDRILQKAVALVLTPGLEAIMSQASYAYRKGLSRQQVRYAIQNAWREGYRWVYESDIDDFFDSVNRRQLFLRLQSVFGADPLWQAMENWLGQSIHYKNTLIERPLGLPQGSPLSPVLANFILDDFDSDLEHHGFKMIRFADDFIILCKSQSQAQQAAEAVKQSLAEIGLTLNADKSHIVTLQQGFRFLGYLFHEDHAIEIGGTTQDGRTSYGAKQSPKNLPPWLANLGEKLPRGIPEEQQPKQQIGDAEEQGSYLILAGDAQVLTTDNHNLIVKKDDIITHKINWEQLCGIILIGLHHMTLPAQHQALRMNIPIHLADRSGHYLGALQSNQPAQKQYKHWFIQMQMADNQDYQLAFAKNLVQSRIHNQMINLKRRKAQHVKVQTTLRQLKQLHNKVPHVNNLHSLHGLEGNATKNYFGCFNLFLPPWAHFAKRNRRPPQDPFNALLSLGYTILYSHVDIILQSQGFLSWKGIYHQQSPAHAALASDIMESYRHLIERFALARVNQKRIKQEDFRHETTPGGQTQIRLSAESRRKYCAALIRSFQKFSHQHTLHQHLLEQAKQLRQSLLNHQPFQPWKESK